MEAPARAARWRDGTLGGRTPFRAAFIRAMSSSVTDIDGEKAGRVEGVDGKAGERGKHQRNQQG